MPTRSPAFDAHVMKIHQVLDRLDYYRLLGIDQAADKSEVKRAFLKITARYHPDRHRNASSPVKDAIYDIFKRLNEAYRVLTDADKRALYDEQLKTGDLRFSMGTRMSMIPKSPEDTIGNRDARQFYLTAREQLDAGHLMQADLHIRMARSREPGNKAIAELQQQVAAAKKK